MSRTAIVIPYREREENLKSFLAWMHPFLQRQDIEYKIYMVSQVRILLAQDYSGEKGRGLSKEKFQSTEDGCLFNRGGLLNIGFLMANQDWDWDCVVLHDVDLLPQIIENVYKCRDQVRSMIHSDKHYRFD